MHDFLFRPARITDRVIRHIQRFIVAVFRRELYTVFAHVVEIDIAEPRALRGKIVFVHSEQISRRQGAMHVSEINILDTLALFAQPEVDYGFALATVNFDVLEMHVAHRVGVIAQLNGKRAQTGMPVRLDRKSVV